MPRPAFAVFDLDGVLADVRHRLPHVEHRPKDWDAFFAAAVHDPVLPEGQVAVRAEQAAGRTIVYVTGRPERCRPDTLAWLERHGLPHGRLWMRSEGDHRPARVVKPELVRRLSREGTVEVVYDDDAAVVVALSTWDIDIVHVTWMRPDPDEEDTLFDAQEFHGRS